MRKQTIKQATVSLERVNADTYPKGQADYNGKTTEFLRLSPSGLDTNPTEGTWVLLLSIQGQESVKVGIPCDLLGQSDDPAVNPGESVLYNKKTGDKVYLKSDGSIEILSSSVKIGVSGFLKLITSAFISFFNSHTHTGVTTGAGTSGVPSTPATEGAHATVNLTAS